MGSICGNPNTAVILSLHTKDKQYVHMKLTDDLSLSLSLSLAHSRIMRPAAYTQHTNLLEARNTRDL